MIKITNGEKIKEIFPQAEITPQYVDMMLIGYDVGIDGESFFSDEWWDAEYKEPTTRNCFGCKYSKDNHNAGTEECHLCMWENQYTPTTKNDLGVDCISRIEVLRLLANSIGKTNTYLQTEVLKMPSVTPQEFIKKLEEQIKQLQNRCHALTHGQMCVFCPYECEYKAEIEPQESEDKE